ncbi:hypothetical protein K1719_017835 [Acacia pycnantha]|nr:hypothetical protein K1719_017835 [Acacia pycnantha]
MDKSWIKMPRSSPVYLAGLNTFLDFTFSHASINGKIPFPEAYTFWEVHGEKRGRQLHSRLRDAFPDADIPSSFYEAKKIINRLGLNYEKIDACPNDCMLYWGEDDRRETCKKFHTSRFKTVRKGKKQTKKPAKILSLPARFETDGCILLRGFLGNLNLT